MNKQNATAQLFRRYAKAVAISADRRRGVAACFHYRRALELELVRRRREQAGERRQLHVERMIREHARIARGYLGAVGFERRSRL